MGYAQVNWGRFDVRDADARSGKNPYPKSQGYAVGKKALEDHEETQRQIARIKAEIVAKATASNK